MTGYGYFRRHMSSDRISQFLQENKKDVRFKAIDDTLGLASGSTARIVSGEKYRHFTPDQQKAVHKYLKQLGKKIGKFLLELETDVS